mmetsp:Transcript_14646/g.27074  ORF Transcript_14646/g.27074 Transcript_14646/m.27074 type:complete len:313 (+) Transcript_14646:58-996(+)
MLLLLILSLLLPSLSAFTFLPPPLSRLSTSLPSSTRGLLFDCDGVILETESIHLLAYNAAYSNNGLVNPSTGKNVEWSVEYYDMLQNKVGGGKNKMKYYFETTSSGVWPTVNGLSPPQTSSEKNALVDKLQSEKTLIYQEMVKSEASARPGFLALLDSALSCPKTGVGVCSASTKSAVETVLSVIMGEERVSKLDVFLAGDDVGSKKPDPEIYRTAVERLGLEGKDCVVVEDSLIGLKAGKGAGCEVVVTWTDSTKQEDFYGNGAAAVMEDLSCFGGITLEDIFPESGEICEGKKEGLKDEDKLRDLLMSLN